MFDPFQNPYRNLDISLIVSSKSYEDFCRLYNYMILPHKDYSNIELMVKIDKMDNRYYELLDGKSFHYKILCYPPYDKRLSNHIFFNDLCSMSSGKLI